MCGCIEVDFEMICISNICSHLGHCQDVWAWAHREFCCLVESIYSYRLECLAYRFFYLKIYIDNNLVCKCAAAWFVIDRAWWIGGRREEQWALAD